MANSRKGEVNFYEEYEDVLYHLPGELDRLGHRWTFVEQPHVFYFPNVT